MGGTKHDRNSFEQRVKDSLDQYEVPYNSADWTQMERALSSGVRGWGHGKSMVAGALIAGALLIGGTAYFLGRDTVTKTSTAKQATTVTGHPALTVVKDRGSEPAPGKATGSKTISGENGLATVQEATGTPSPVHHSAPAPQVKKAAMEGSAAVVTSTPATSGIAPSPSSTGAIFHASAKEACPGTPVQFTVERMQEDGIYLWNFGDGSFSNKPNPEHTFNKPGSYQVMLSLSSAGGGTIHNKPSSDVIVVHDGPAAAFDLTQVELPGQIPSVHLENRSENATSFAWNFGDGRTSTSYAPDHIFKNKGDYQVELTATNGAGCIDRSITMLRVDHDYDLGASSHFSPNGDGMDDSFMPTALHALQARFQLAIYDTAGTLLYSTTDASLPWNGRPHNQGTACAAGDYVWVVDVDAGAQQPPETFTGKVKLER